MKGLVNVGGANKINWSGIEKDLLQEYGLSNLRIKGEYRSVLQLGSNSGDFALKCIALKQKNLQFLLEVLGFLKLRGFTNFQALVPTLSGQYWISEKAGTYILAKWIEGRESNLSDSRDLGIYARTLGQLHRLTAGFRPVGNPWEERWSAKLLELVNISEDISCPERIKKLIPAVINSGDKALSLLKNPEVARSLSQPAVVCHHDLTYRNFIITPNNEGFFIDFDYAKADVALRDLAQFLAKVIKDNNSETAVHILSVYAEERPLSNGDIGAMLAFLYFPRSLWGFGERIRNVTGRKAYEEAVSKVEKRLARQDSLDNLCSKLGF